MKLLILSAFILCFAFVFAARIQAAGGRDDYSRRSGDRDKYEEKDYDNMSQDEINGEIQKKVEDTKNRMAEMVEAGYATPERKKNSQQTLAAMEKLKTMSMAEQKAALGLMEDMRHTSHKIRYLIKKSQGKGGLAVAKLGEKVEGYLDALSDMGLDIPHWGKYGRRVGGDKYPGSSGGQDTGSYTTKNPEAYNVAKGLMGDNPWINGMQTKAYAERGNHPETAATAQKWAAQTPNNPEPYIWMGNAFEKMGDYKSAYDSGMKALRLNPRSGRARALVKLTQGRAGPTSAQAPTPDFADFRPLERETPPILTTDIPSNKLRTSYNLAKKAQRMMKQKDFPAAAKAAKAAVRVNPQNINARYSYILSLMQMRRYQEAADAAGEALRYAPDNARILTVRANAFNMLKQYDQALRSADMAIRADPAYAKAHFQKAWAHDGIGGQRGDALAAMRRAAQFDPRYQKYLDQMLSLEDGELALFFAGEGLLDSGAASGKEEGESSGIWGLGKGKRRTMMLGLTGIIGGFLIMLGLLRSATWKWRDAVRKITILFSRESPEVGGYAGGVPSANGSPGYVSDALSRNYEVTREIGVGGMGIVYEGKDRSLDRRVAIKKMRDEIRMDSQERERFLTEARTVATLHHPNIVEIFSIVEDGRDAFLIFEFVDGKTVHDIIQKKGKLSFSESIVIIRGAAAALDYAHKHGVIHRDLKPSNVMVNREGQVKVMDFGVARMAKDSLSRLSRTNNIVGTPPYMAPEQEQGMVRKASDVYALAVMLYEMTTGSLPFNGVGAGMLMAKINKTYVPAGRIVQGLPAGFDDVMSRALEPDPEKRWASASEFLGGLESLSLPR